MGQADCPRQYLGLMKLTALILCILLGGAPFQPLPEPVEPVHSQTESAGGVFLMTGFLIAGVALWLAPDRKWARDAAIAASSASAGVGLGLVFGGPGEKASSAQFVLQPIQLPHQR